MGRITGVTGLPLVYNTKPQGMKQFILNCKLKDHVVFPYEWKAKMHPDFYSAMTLMESDGKAQHDNYKWFLMKYYYEE